MEVFIGVSIYLALGFLIMIMGIYLHSKEWDMSFKQSFDFNIKPYSFMALFWPLTLYLLLNHYRPSKYK